MDIEKLRERIDRIDRQMLALLNRRVRAARQIGKMKAQTDAVVYAPDREAAIHLRLAESNQGPLCADALQAIYTEVISACRASERALRIAFLGPEGTFSHHAARRKFGSCFEPVAARAIEQVFSEVEARRADYGVVPVENSVEGAVTGALNGLMESDVNICGEICVRIHHNLLAPARRRKIERIYSKAEALAQCRVFLGAHYPDAELIPASSTAEAAELASRDPAGAAIGRREVAHRNKLKALREAIEDSPFNMTRFLVIGDHLVPQTDRDRTSILCFVRDEVGALVRLLAPFQKSGISLTKIESRPSRRKPWDYCFFIDFLGHYDDPNVAQALDRVSRRCTEMKLLGSYPVDPAA